MASDDGDTGDVVQVLAAAGQDALQRVRGVGVCRRGTRDAQAGLALEAGDGGFGRL